MKKVLVALLLSVFAGPVALAQQAIPAPKKEFLDSTFTVLPSEVGARYWRETEYADSVGGTVNTFFLTGKKEGSQSFEHIQKRIPNGVFEMWFANGQLSLHEDFSHGRRIGELRTYYPSGQLKRREVFDPKDSFASSGECFGEDGQALPFFKFEQMPVYPDGDGSNRALIMAVMRRVKYPRDALKAGRAGRVLVSFNVTETGEVADVKVMESVFPSLDAAVVQAVQQLKRFKPGLYDGRPVSVAFTLPFTFAIQ